MPEDVTEQKGWSLQFRKSKKATPIGIQTPLPSAAEPENEALELFADMQACAERAKQRGFRLLDIFWGEQEGKLVALNLNDASPSKKQEGLRIQKKLGLEGRAFSELIQTLQSTGKVEAPQLRSNTKKTG